MNKKIILCGYIFFFADLKKKQEDDIYVLLRWCLVIPRGMGQIFAGNRLKKLTNMARPWVMIH